MDSVLEGRAVREPERMASYIKLEVSIHVLIFAVKIKQKHNSYKSNILTWERDKISHRETSLGEALLKLRDVKGGSWQLSGVSCFWNSAVFSPFRHIPSWTSRLVCKHITAEQTNKKCMFSLFFWWGDLLVVSNSVYNYGFIHICIYKLTKATASRAERAKISAQETTPGHIASTAFFALSMT